MGDAGQNRSLATQGPAPDGPCGLCGNSAARPAEVGKRSKLAKGTLSEIKLPRGVLVAAVQRGTSLLVPRGSDRVEPGDRVLLISTSENAGKLSDFLAD